MEIFGVEFESWNVVLLRLNWFAIILLLVIIFVVSWIYSVVNNRISRKSITIDEINLGIGDSSVKLTYNKKDQAIAYKLWVELSTRKIGLMFDKEYDVITEVYNSWYEFFKIARELLKDIPASRLPYSNDLIVLTEKVLNKGLRPHLTTWQAKYRKWYEKELLNNTGASGDTAFFKKHSNINGFRTPEQRNYLYSALLKQSISAAIARFIFR